MYVPMPKSRMRRASIDDMKGIGEPAGERMRASTCREGTARSALPLSGARRRWRLRPKCGAALRAISSPVSFISGLTEAARRDRRRTQADAAGIQRRIDVERNRVLIDGDSRAIERCSASLPRTPFENTSTQHDVRIGAARNHAETLIHQSSAQALWRWRQPASGTRRTRASRPRGSTRPWLRSRGPAVRLACPGKTFLSMAGPYFAFARIRPERGPRSVLCVVDVTISA